MLYYLGGVNTIEKTHSSGHLGVLKMVHYSNVNVTHSLRTLPAEWGMCYVASEKKGKVLPNVTPLWDNFLAVWPL